MATQLATTDTAPKALAKAPVTAGNRLAAFVPTSLEEAWRLSGALAASGMTPKTYGTDQNKIMVGILAGAEIGMTPFVALQSISVINGTPALWGDGMLGLVEASGLLEDFKETDDGKEATCWAKRKGRPTPVVNTFSMEDAKTAGLMGKQGPWQQYTKRMRKLRARSFTLRDLFSDVLKGIKSAEEAHDYAPMGGMALHAQPVTAGMIEDQADYSEGPSDNDRGETHNGTGADHPARKIADDLIGKASLAKSAAGVDAIDRELDQHRDTMSEDLITEVEMALSDARGLF